MIEFSNSLDAISCTGWVYCLAIANGKQCKIGMTKKQTIRERYPRQMVTLAWAFKGWQTEKQVHEVLEKHRLNKTFYQWKTAKGKRVEGYKVTCKKWMNKHERKMKYDSFLNEEFALTPAQAKRIINQKIHPRYSVTSGV